MYLRKFAKEEVIHHKMYKTKLVSWWFQIWLWLFTSLFVPHILLFCKRKMVQSTVMKLGL